MCVLRWPIYCVTQKAASFVWGPEQEITVQSPGCSANYSSNRASWPSRSNNTQVSVESSAIVWSLCQTSIWESLCRPLRFMRKSIPSSPNHHSPLSHYQALVEAILKTMGDHATWVFYQELGVCLTCWAVGWACVAGYHNGWKWDFRDRSSGGFTKHKSCMSKYLRFLWHQVLQHGLLSLYCAHASRNDPYDQLTEEEVTQACFIDDSVQSAGRRWQQQYTTSHGLPWGQWQRQILQVVRTLSSAADCPFF